jgi:putative copper resistance protein D
MAAISIARGIYFDAVMVLFGASVFEIVLKKRLPIIVPVKLPRLLLLLSAFLAGVIWFILASAEMAGTLSVDAIWQAACGTLFGQLFLVRIALLLGLALTPRRRGRWAAVFSGIALVLPSATGHAAASSPAGFTVIGASLDGIHLLTAAFWIGGLAVLGSLFRRKEPNILLALSLFSDWAMVAVLLLVMTGLIEAASILLGGANGPGPMRPAIAYLGVLGTKLIFVLVMIGLAAANRFRLVPRGDDKTIAHNAALELMLGLIVVLLAGALGQLSAAQ